MTSRSKTTYRVAPWGKSRNKKKKTLSKATKEKISVAMKATLGKKKEETEFNRRVETKYVALMRKLGYMK